MILYLRRPSLDDSKRRSPSLPAFAGAGSRPRPIVASPPAGSSSAGRRRRATRSSPRPNADPSRATSALPSSSAAKRPPCATARLMKAPADACGALRSARSQSVTSTSQAPAIQLEQPAAAVGVGRRHLDRLIDPARPGGQRRFEHVRAVRRQARTGCPTSSASPSIWLSSSKSRALAPTC